MGVCVCVTGVVQADEEAAVKRSNSIIFT